MKDITWITPQGTEKTPEQWRDAHARCLGLLLGGRAGRHLRADGLPEAGATLLIVVNAHHDAVPFVLPALPGGDAWRCLLDTGHPTGAPPTREFPAGRPAAVGGRTTLLFQLIDEPHG